MAHQPQTAAIRTSNQPVGADRWGAPLFLGGMAGLLVAAGIYFGGWGLVWQSQGKGFQATPALHHLLPGRQGGDRPHEKAVAFMQAEHPAVLKALEVGPQIAGLLVGGLIFWMTLGDVAIATQDRHIRGRRRLQGEAALTAWVKDEGEDADGLHIHPILPPITKSRETRHLLIFGGVGSGKTQTILPLMRAARARGDRMVIFDLKNDFTREFASKTKTYKGNEVEVVDAILAPWDSRSMSWAVAHDVDTLAAAREFSARMIPEAQGGTPFFSNAARQVLIASLVELQSESPEKWGFADLSKKLVRPIDELAEAARAHFPEALKALSDGQQNVTSAGVLGNMMSYLSVVFDLARAWPSPGIFSIRDWLQEKNKATKSVVLQHNGQFESLARAFNGAVLGLASQLINSPLMSESSSRRLWFFLDEFPQIGKVESIFPMAEIGRSKGVRLVVGLQDISQLKKIYSEHQASALVSMVGTHIVTKVSSGETADFITEKLIGEREIERLDVSTSSGTGRTPGLFTPGGTRTSSWKPVREPVMLPAQLHELGPGKNGVKVAILGIGQDALEIEIPYSVPATLRPGSVIADWTRFPRAPIVPAIPLPLQQEQAPQPQPAPSWTVEDVVEEAPANCDDIDGDEAGEGEESAPSPEASTDKPDPLDFLDGGESAEKTPPPQIETRMLPVSTPLAAQLADQAKEAKEEAAESLGSELATHAGIAALPTGLSEIAHVVEIIDLVAAVALPQTDVLPVSSQGEQQPPKKRKFRLKKAATPQLEESI